MAALSGIYGHVLSNSLRSLNPPPDVVDTYGSAPTIDIIVQYGITIAINVYHLPWAGRQH